MNSYKVVVVSLVSSKRRDCLKERLALGGIREYEIIDALEPSPLLDDRLQALTGSEWTNDPRLKNMDKNEARKACYLSHVQKVLGKYDEPLIVLEDDIVFKSPLTDLPPLPEDASIGFLDGTKIEKFKGYDFCESYSCGWLPISTSQFRVWCSGCYICPDPKRLYNTIISQTPKVYDKLLIDCFQRDAKSYVYLPIIAKQDRRSFKSTIA